MIYRPHFEQVDWPVCYNHGTIIIIVLTIPLGMIEVVVEHVVNVRKRPKLTESWRGN